MFAFKKTRKISLILVFLFFGLLKRNEEDWKAKGKKAPLILQNHILP